MKVNPTPRRGKPDDGDGSEAPSAASVCSGSLGTTGFDSTVRLARPPPPANSVRLQEVSPSDMNPSDMNQDDRKNPPKAALRDDVNVDVDRIPENRIAESPGKGKGYTQPLASRGDTTDDQNPKGRFFQVAAMPCSLDLDAAATEDKVLSKRRADLDAKRRSAGISQARAPASHSLEANVMNENETYDTQRKDDPQTSQRPDGILAFGKVAAKRADTTTTKTLKDSKIKGQLTPFSNDSPVRVEVGVVFDREDNGFNSGFAGSSAFVPTDGEDHGLISASVQVANSTQNHHQVVAEPPPFMRSLDGLQRPGAFHQGGYQTSNSHISHERLVDPSPEDLYSAAANEGLPIAAEVVAEDLQHEPKPELRRRDNNWKSWYCLLAIMMTTLTAVGGLVVWLVLRNGSSPSGPAPGVPTIAPIATTQRPVQPSDSPSLAPSFKPTNIKQCFATKTELSAAVGRYSEDSVDAFLQQSYGWPIGRWCVSQVPDLSFLFENKGTFNSDISDWDTSRVTNMEGMFRGATAFNKPLEAWNVSQVETMDSMFLNASSFNQDLGGWDVSRVTSMNSMFEGANNFNKDLRLWNVSNVRDMGFMFYKAISFDQDLETWDVSRVAVFERMFSGASFFNGNVSTWNIKSATSVGSMFDEALLFNSDLSGWDVSRVTDFNHMVRYTAFNQNISSWNMSQASDLEGMFDNCHDFNQDLSLWDVSNVSNMIAVFYQALSFNGDISTWDVSKVTRMNFTFSGTNDFNQDISRWNVARVESMRLMFYNAKSFNHDISSWDVSSVIDMYFMFDGANAFNQDLSAWNVSNCNTFNYMFSGSPSFRQNLCSWGDVIMNTSDVTGMFDGSNCTSTSDPDLTASPKGPFCFVCS